MNKIKNRNLYLLITSVIISIFKNILIGILFCGICGGIPLIILFWTNWLHKQKYPIAYQINDNKLTFFYKKRPELVFNLKNINQIKIIDKYPLTPLQYTVHRGPEIFILSFTYTDNNIKEIELECLKNSISHLYNELKNYSKIDVLPEAYKNYLAPFLTTSAPTNNIRYAFIILITIAIIAFIVVIIPYFAH